MLRPILVAFSVAALAACGSEPPRADVSALRLVREGEQYPMITGYLVNRGAVPISSADVFVTLYDADNRPLEDVAVQVRAVAVGDSSRFERQLDIQPAGARVKLVSAN